MSRRAITVVAVGLGLSALCPAAAQAHLVTTGFGPICDGITHFGLSPEDFLPVIALGFYAGLAGPAHARVALAATVSAWVVGGGLAMAGVAAPTVAVSSMTAALYLLIGGCLAAKWAPTRTLTMALGVGLGLLRGWAGFMDAPADPARAASLAGVAAAVFVALALSASITLPLRQGWTITAARVAGSWLAALGLLLAGWILRFGAAAL